MRRHSSSNQFLNKLMIWRAVAVGISFIALILIASKLFSLCREISFLETVQAEWLPKQNNSNNGSKLQPAATATSQAFHIENLRQDIEILIIELWSSRTTLILGLIFLFVYIITWGSITYFFQEEAISLKSVLLLVIFAAVDITASTGFIMVRAIVHSMRGSDFLREMRQPTVHEHDQLAAFVTLRLLVLQLSSNMTDIFVSGLVAFLTAIRVYIVSCAVKFYNQARSETMASERKYSSTPWSLTSASIAGDDPDVGNDLKIQAADMPAQMQRTAMHSVIQAIRLYSTEKHIAESVKQDFDTMYGPTWHCIVGRNWGSCVTHSKECYIRIQNREFTILLYKSA